MRRNTFREAYCCNVSRARHCLMLADLEADDVYAIPVEKVPGEDACAEIARSDSGETVCYVESPSILRVMRIIKEVEIECPE